jgi:protein SCO1
MALVAVFLFAACERHEAAPPPAALPSLSLWQLEGRWSRAPNGELELASLRGAPALVLFFYGTCEYACPALVRNLQAVERQLAATARAKVRFVLVTIDPERDTIERLTSYAREHELDPSRWVLLRGAPEQIRELAAAVGVRYRAGGSGQFSHTMRIVLVDRDGVEVSRWDGLDQRVEPIVRAVTAEAERG